MVVKEVAKKSATDRFLAAGLRAERQMHHYLDRAFRAPEDVCVLSDLRLVDGRDVAQIDHLILHRWGLVIVESKSVCGEIEVNEHGEWTRRFGGRVQGMPSPILQAQRQSELLRALLQRHAHRLRDRGLTGLIRRGFRSCPIDVFVAVSDEGRIRRSGTDPAEVKKADQVPGAIREIIERHRKGAKLLTVTGNPFSKDGAWELNLGEMWRIRDFLLERHRPLPNGRQIPRESAGLRPAVNGADPSDAGAMKGKPAPPGVQQPPAVIVVPAKLGPAPVPCCRWCGSTKLRWSTGRPSAPTTTAAPHAGKSPTPSGPVVPAGERPGCGRRAPDSPAGASRRPAALRK
jgi:hypothetical protein